MKSDLTSLSFDPRRRFTAVVMQQGRVQLDCDWDEDVAIQRHLKNVAAIRSSLESEEIDEAFIDRHFDPAVVIEESSARKWEGHEGAAVWVSANVAEATQGETVIETIGGGAGEGNATLVSIARPGPSAIVFELRDGRFIRVQAFPEATAALASAGLSALELTTDDDGRTSVAFGDGRAGEPLPSSGVIVSARYRSGSGEAGDVGADALTVVVVGTRAEAEAQPSRWLAPAAAAAMLAAVWSLARRRCRKRV